MICDGRFLDSILVSKKELLRLWESFLAMRSSFSEWLILPSFWKQIDCSLVGELRRDCKLNVRLAVVWPWTLIGWDREMEVRFWLFAR